MHEFLGLDTHYFVKADCVWEHAIDSVAYVGPSEALQGEGPDVVQCLGVLGDASPHQHVLADHAGCVGPAVGNHGALARGLDAAPVSIVDVQFLNVRKTLTDAHRRVVAPRTSLHVNLLLVCHARVPLPAYDVPSFGFKTRPLIGRGLELVRSLDQVCVETPL